MEPLAGFVFETEAGMAVVAVAAGTDDVTAELALC